MSDKEKIIELLDDVSDSSLPQIISYIEEIIENENDAKIDAAAKLVLEKYRNAFGELAK